MLKTKTITTDKATVLVVELSDGITEVTNTGKRLAIPDRKGGHHFFEGKWQLIGRLPDITEEQAERIVDKHKSTFGVPLSTHLEALSSLLQSNEVCFDNPLGERPVQSEFYWGFLHDLGKWNEAQSKVWDKERCYLFIKED